MYALLSLNNIQGDTFDLDAKQNRSEIGKYFRRLIVKFELLLCNPIYLF